MSIKPITMMFADVSGSSRLFKTMGNQHAREIIAQAIAMMTERTEENQGRVIKTIGDEVMAAFDAANQATQAAIAIQNTINSSNTAAPISIRIGLHTGPVISEEGDIYGEAVNDTAAIVKEAKGGQILISQLTVATLNPHLQLRCSHFDHLRLKGGQTSAEIKIVQWEDEEDESDATIVRSAITAEMMRDFAVSDEITLTYLGEKIVLNKENTPFSIGRGRNTDLRLKSKMASREHCTIDFHRGKFVLIEKSTNGTYLMSQGRDSVYIRREEAPLTGSGLIGFGIDHSLNAEDTLEYEC